MPATSSPRASVVRACLLALVASVGDPAEAVEIVIRSNGSSIVYSVSAEEVRAILGPVERPALTGLESELLAVLTEKGSKPAAIAHRAGKRPHQHVYAALKSLVAKGCAVKDGSGNYRLA